MQDQHDIVARPTEQERGLQSASVCCGLRVKYRLGVDRPIKRTEVRAPGIASGIFLAALLICFVFLLSGCSGRQQSLVVYASQDEVYAEPIFRAFTAETGVRVLPVYDSEAVKTVGLANRLLAERQRPQCDVFWNNEMLRTCLLTDQNVFRTQDPWQSLGYRSRRMVINTNKLSLATAPKSYSELTNAVWQKKIALAYPLFGTTSTHFQALRQSWGESRWETWCRALEANHPLLVDGNSVVVKMVASGEAWVGLTDSDDIASGVREGLPVAALPLTEDSMLIPNTIAIIRDAPHPAEAQLFRDYMQKPEVLAQLIAAHALEGGSVSQSTARTLKVDYALLVKDLDQATTKLKELFLR